MRISPARSLPGAEGARSRSFPWVYRGGLYAHAVTCLHLVRAREDATSSVRDIFAASEEYYEEDDPNDSFTFVSVERELYYRAEVILRGFVIVVDWDF